MKLREILLNEMSINIDRLHNPIGPPITIQIRTGNVGSGPAGITEHPPAHIHVIIPPNVNVPYEIMTAQPLRTGHPIQGSLTKFQYSKIVQFLDYYGREELKQIFDTAQRGNDPQPLFDTLKQRKQQEYKQQNVTNTSQNKT